MWVRGKPFGTPSTPDQRSEFRLAESESSAGWSPPPPQRNSSRQGSVPDPAEGMADDGAHRVRQDSKRGVIGGTRIGGVATCRDRGT